jgi:flagellar biosynthesis GTPase FlhF
MKLHKFEAENNHKAYMMIHKELGPNALIYATKKTARGIEITAGFEGDEVNHQVDLSAEMSVKSPILDSHYSEMVDLLDIKLQKLYEKINLVGRELDISHLVNYDDSFFSKDIYSQVINKFREMNFSSSFVAKVINRKVNKYINQNLSVDEIVSYILSDLISTKAEVFNVKRKVMTLIGPTGSGKTLTIAKIAYEYIKKYGTESVGLITTDFNDIAGVNQLFHYSKMLNIQIEYAHDNAELKNLLSQMKDKRLVLIDTYGVSYNYRYKKNSLTALFDCMDEKINFYLTLACNVQDVILESTVKDFDQFSLDGCILTKQDEAVTLANVISVCASYKIPISYVTNHQNIQGGISSANKQMIVSDLLGE